MVDCLGHRRLNMILAAKMPSQPPVRRRLYLLTPKSYLNVPCWCRIPEQRGVIAYDREWCRLHQPKNKIYLVVPQAGTAIAWRLLQSQIVCLVGVSFRPVLGRNPKGEVLNGCKISVDAIPSHRPWEFFGPAPNPLSSPFFFVPHESPSENLGVPLPAGLCGPCGIHWLSN